MPIAPMGPVQRKHGGRTTGSTGITPAFPAQWFTAYNAFSPVTGFLATVADGIASASLMPASGHQDHATSPSASGALVNSTVSVHRIPPRVRDVAQRPSVWDGMAADIELICSFGKPEYFFERGWTGVRAADEVICPTRQNIFARQVNPRSIGNSWVPFTPSFLATCCADATID